MSEHFNGLTPAEAERLAMLAEEAGEVVQIVGKILRHGYDSYHPDDPTTDNRALLAREIADFTAVLVMMEAAQDVAVDRAEHIEALCRKLRFTHHQREGD